MTALLPEDVKALRKLAEAATIPNPGFAEWDMRRAITPRLVLALLAELEAARSENLKLAAAVSWLAHNVAEDAGGCPDWYHLSGCPEDDTCRCPNPETIAKACRLVGPPDSVDAARARWEKTQ